MKWITPLIAGICLMADLASKRWVRTHLAGGTQAFIPGLLRLTLTSNAGAAFGLGRGIGWLVSLIAVAILSGIMIWTIQRERSHSPLTIWERAGIGFLLGGALGNILERLLQGKVTDFLEFTFINFPVFNLADVLIDLGVLILVAKFFSSGQTRSDNAPD